MEITVLCKMGIVSNKGNTLFDEGIEYKGHIQEVKNYKLFMIKDSTGCFQSLPDGKFFDQHFKVIQNKVE